MTGWVVATATAAVIGAAAMGPAEYGQQGNTWVVQPNPPAVQVLQEVEVGPVVSDFDQAIRYQLLGGSGGRIGVTIRDLSDDELKTGKATGGVKIDEVETDSPAAKAGFRSGDVVVEFDGERVRSSRQFARLVQETPPGRSAQTVVVRDGQRVTLSVLPRDGGSLAMLKGGRVKIAPPFPEGSFDFAPKIATILGAGRLGISVDELSSQLAEYFGTKDGVLVTSVIDNSAASKAGVKAGDVITSLNGGAVTSAADVRRRAQRLEDSDEFTLSVVRDRKPLTLKGKIEVLQVKRPAGRTIL